VQLTSPGRERVQVLRERIDEAAHSELAPDDLTLRLRELAADFRAAIDADLARQGEEVRNRIVDRESDLAAP